MSAFLSLNPTSSNTSLTVFSRKLSESCNTRRRVEILRCLHVLIRRRNRHISDHVSDGARIAHHVVPRGSARTAEGAEKVAKIRKVVVFPAPFEPMN
jgi:hypothetical protein